jgi:hypothetical protein
MKIVAAFSKRYEPEYLVDELRENLAWCDDIICYDDSTRDPKDTQSDFPMTFIGCEL